MPKAQEDFFGLSRSDKNADSRCFTTWYRTLDVHRIAYSFYLQQPQEAKNLVAAPHSLFETNGVFEHEMNYYFRQFIASEKNILPFITRPEIGGAHFMAGFIRRNKTSNQVEFFLFNPTGYTAEQVRKRLNVNDITNVAGMAMHFSSTRVQTIEKDSVGKDNEAALVSCGPISLIWLMYLLKNPEYALNLNHDFVLPPELYTLETMDKKAYQASIVLTRKEHGGFLGLIADKDLDDIDNSAYRFLHQYMTSSVQKFEQKACDYVEYYYEDEDGNEFVLGNETDYIGEDIRDPGVENKQEFALEEDRKLASNVSNELAAHREEASPATNNETMGKESFIKLQFEKKEFDHLLKKLKRTVQAFNNYQEIQSGEKLVGKLIKAEAKFFEGKNPDIFIDQCLKAIKEAKREIGNYTGWYALSPILRGILGVLAALTILPALMVQTLSAHSYAGTFFSLPNNKTMEELETIEKELTTLILEP